MISDPYFCDLNGAPASIEEIANPQYQPLVRIDFKIDGRFGYSVHYPNNGKIAKFKYKDPFGAFTQEIKILRAQLMGRASIIMPYVVNSNSPW